MRSDPDVVLDPSQTDDALVREWDALAESTGGSYFQSGTWALAWWEHLAGRPETRIALWRGVDGSLEAVCALSRVERPVLRTSGPSISVWVNAGSGAGAGDHLGWPAVDSRRTEAVDWAVRACPGPILLSNLTSERSSGLANRGFDLIDVSPTLVAELGPGDAWFPGSKDFRKKLRYYGRQLDKADISLEMIDATRIDQPLFERLLELHATRSEHMGWGTHFDEHRLAFHMQLIREADAKGGPVMCVARRHDEVVGVLYGFRFGSSFAYYQTGWSREYVKQSLGSVLVAHSMEWAAGDGAVTFDFLRGDDEYKRRFGARPRGDETWMLPRGLSGAALRARHFVASLLEREAS